MSDPDPLAGWVVLVADDLGIDPGDVDVGLLLDVARDSAHGVVRPAAPITTYLVGLAQGRARGGTAELHALADRIDVLLATRNHSDTDTED